MKLSIPVTVVALAVAASGWTYALQDRGQDRGGTQVWAQQLARQGSRILMVRGASEQDFAIAGQFHVTYASVPWREEHAMMAEQAAPGERMRLGKDVWTEFETNVPLTIGGMQVPADQYYLLLEKAADGFALVAVPSDEVRAQKLDALQSSEVEGGIVIPLAMESEEGSDEDLTIALEKGAGGQGPIAMLNIAFGPHRATAEISARAGG